MQYTIASVKQAYALPRGTLVFQLERQGIYEADKFSRDELVTNWLRFYGEEEVNNVVVDPCGHKPTEDCMNCVMCSRCSESLDEEDVCADCLEEEVITDTAGRSYMLTDEEGLR